MANVLHEPGMVTVSHDEVNEKYSLQSQSGFLFFSRFGRNREIVVASHSDKSPTTTCVYFQDMGGHD